MLDSYYMVRMCCGHKHHFCIQEATANRNGSRMYEQAKFLSPTLALLRQNLFSMNAKGSADDFHVNGTRYASLYCVCCNEMYVFDYMEFKLPCTLMDFDRWLIRHGFPPNVHTIYTCTHIRCVHEILSWTEPSAAGQEAVLTESHTRFDTSQACPKNSFLGDRQSYI